MGPEEIVLSMGLEQLCWRASVRSYAQHTASSAPGIEKVIGSISANANKDPDEIQYASEWRAVLHTFHGLTGFRVDVFPVLALFHRDVPDCLRRDFRCDHRLQLRRDLTQDDAGYRQRGHRDRIEVVSTLSTRLRLGPEDREQWYHLERDD